MVDTTISTPVEYKPPFRDAPLDAGKTAFSDAWVGWFTDVSDRLTLLTQRVGIAEGDVSSIGTGVTDGSDAPAGHIGEFLQVTGGAVALTSGAGATIVSLNLTPGDWQMDGNALFTPSVGAHATQLMVGSGTSPTVVYYATNISTTFATGVGTLLSIGYPTRFNISAALTVYVVAAAAFTGGTMTAQGHISARRAR